MSIPITLLIFAAIRYFVQEVILYELTGIHNYAKETREVSYYIKDNFFFDCQETVLNAITASNSKVIFFMMIGF